MGRPPFCDKREMKRGPWTPEEDIILVSYIQEHGPGNWRSVPINTGLNRCSKSCRLRWTNYLKPGIKRGGFTEQEEKVIIHLQALLGNRWASIASYLPSRTDNDVKNYWNTHLKKRLRKLQEDAGALPKPKGQWEQALRADIHKAKEALQAAATIMEESSTSPSTVGSSSGTYFCSIENISRLLEGWMRKPMKAPTTSVSTPAATSAHVGKAAVEPSSSSSSSAVVLEGVQSLVGFNELPGMRDGLEEESKWGSKDWMPGDQMTGGVGDVCSVNGLDLLYFGGYYS